MDIKTISAAQHEAVKKTVNDENRIVNNPANAVTEPGSTNSDGQKSAISVVHDSLSLSADSLNLAKVNGMNTEKQYQTIETSQQAQKVAQNIAATTRNNPEQALAAFGNASTGRLNSLLA